MSQSTILSVLEIDLETILPLETETTMTTGNQEKTMNSSSRSSCFERSAHEHRYLEAVQTAEQMGRLLDAVEGAMIERSYPPQDVFAVRLLLEEAILNAIKHGHRGDVSKVVCICCNVSDREVAASVQDEGPGFNFADVPDPCADENLDKPSGRGLLLMRTYATSLYYNDRGNGVTFFRRRSSVAPSASAAQKASTAPEVKHGEEPHRTLVKALDKSPGYFAAPRQYNHSCRWPSTCLATRV
jgi:serine/threonine-protein kinase RsbW